jgi:hypothetical protein
MRTMIVVYSEEELASRLPSAEPDSLPLGMRAMIEEIAGKLPAGRIGFSQAEAYLDAAQHSMACWPLVATPAQVGHDWHALAQALVAERVARARDEPADVRARLAVAGAWPARVRWARPCERPRRGPAMCCTASEEART